MRPRAKKVWIASIVTILAVMSASELLGQGPVVTGVGTVNRSMGGAGTAAPLEAIGALHWNPGSIGALPSNEVTFGLELLEAGTELSSNIPALGPPGTTSSEPGVAVIPSVGWVHHREDSAVSIGLGIYGIAGFRLNYPLDPNHPLLSGATGLGPLFADAEFLQVAPTLCYAVNERLAIGVAPTVTLAKLNLVPIGPPVTPGVTPGSGNRVHWGGGGQIGVYYIAATDWHLGLTVKSPQWFEEFRFFTPGGVVKYDLDYPMIVSLGTAYSGFPDWTLALDVRYFDFKSTDGFSELGWSSVFAMAVGAQRRINDCWHLRLGYSYNQNPIKSGDAFLNISTPLLQQHNFATGFSYRFAANVDISLAYVYLLNSEVTGPTPLGGTVTSEIDAHSGLMGVTVRY